MSLTQTIWHLPDAIVICGGIVLIILGIQQMQSNTTEGIAIAVVGILAIIVGIVTYILSEATDEEIAMMSEYP